jgi:flagellar hook-associated protein 1 FlgK
MGSNLFTSALSGMNAAQIGLATTEHNIANANTPGFTRQEVLIGSRAPQYFGGSFLGQGVDVSGVVRIYDQFLSTQVLQEQTQAAYLSSYHTAIKQIDNLVADPLAGASPAMQELFDAANGVANAPDSIPARQTMLGGAQYVVNRFQAIDQRLTDIANGLNQQMTSSVNQINSLATQIATLNSNIKRATAQSSQGQVPNDLLDQRDQMINTLNKEIKVTVQNQSDGSANVFIGNGQALVIDEQAMSLKLVQSSQDPSRLDVAYQSKNKTIPLQQNSLQGGNLGSYIAFRDQSLESARNALGRVALGIATSMNEQNRMGIDLSGAAGGDIFAVAPPRVDKGAYNTGSGLLSASVSSVSALTTSDYQLRFDATGYSLIRLSDNTVSNLGATLPQTVDGITVNMTGTPAPGDTFFIRPTSNAARDIKLLINDASKIAAAAPMRSATALTNLGNATISAGSVNTPLPLDPNVQAPLTIVFDNPPTTFTVTGAVPDVSATPMTYTTGDDISYNGWTVQISGTPKAGDTFSVGPNTNAVGDNRNALLLAGLQNQNLLANGTTGLQGAYGQMVGEIGAKTHELDVTSQAQSNMAAQTLASQQSISGVNLDEEAANLMRYQKAYQAAAKAMQIANTMFDALLGLGG